MREVTMSEENKAIVRRYRRSTLQTRLHRLGEVLADTFVAHALVRRYAANC